MALTASAPAPVLLGALARAGWGDLAGRQWHGLRQILRALVDVLPAKSALGQTTALQVADAAGGYSERWTRHLMEELETIGLITWTRGGILHGRPQPSLVRISKRRLLELVRSGRISIDEIRAKRAARTTARLRGLRMVTVRPRRSGPAGSHAELTTSPPPYGGGVSAREARAPAPTPPPDDFTPAPMPAYLREAIRRRDPSIIDAYLKEKNLQ